MTYDQRVPEIWVGLDAGARRRNWWWTAVLTLIFAGMATAVFMSAQEETGSSAAESRWWAGAVGAGWLCGVFYMVNRGYGRTLLTPDGMRFHTFVSRRSIRWSDVTGIETTSHQARGGVWWDVRVERVAGRPLAIPGIFSARRNDPLFERNLTVVREYWLQATTLE